MQMSLRFRRALAVLLSALAGTACSLLESDLEAADAVSEYYERLAKCPPRSADAFVDVGLWCQSIGLEDKGAECFQRAISIDADCEKARIALGYRRYGLGWLKQGVSPKSAVKLASLSATESKEGSGSGAQAKPKAGSAGGRGIGASSSAADKPPPLEASSESKASELEGTSTPGGPGATPQGAGEPGASGDPGSQDQESEGLEVEVKAKKPKDGSRGKGASEELEKKRAWATAAGEKIGVTFFTVEDNDFMIHSTLPASSREMKTLVSNLKSLKRVLSGLVGGGSGTRIWPAKLQFFLLKSEPEFERFGQMVDGLKSAKNPDAAYVMDDHAVVWNPETGLLPRILGESALDKLNGSDRYVAWWLKLGIAELLYAQSPSGQKELYYSQAMKYAADLIESEGHGLKIFNLIETADYKAKDRTRNEALALSLMDYLFKKSRGGVRDFIRDLKSDKAPAPPTTEAEFKAFFNLSYRSFQEEAIQSAFHMTVDALGEQWKSYVLAVAEKIKAEEAATAAADAANKKRGKKDRRGR